MCQFLSDSVHPVTHLMLLMCDIKYYYFCEFWTTLRRNPVIVCRLRSQKVSIKTIKPFGNVRPTEIQGY